MPIETSWIQEPYIRLSRYEGAITSADIEAMLDRELALYDSLPHKIYVILDSEQMTRLATNPLKMPRLIKLLNHPTVAYLMMVGADPVAKFWAQTVSKVFATTPIRPARSVEEAIGIAQSLMRTQSA